MRWNLLVLCCTLSVARASWAADVDVTDPDAELRTFKVAEGYEVNLFASERDGIAKPVQMRWDARGRLWVACIPSYPQPTPEEKADDRIVVLEDTRGAGRADRSTVFARGLSLPLGLELSDDGVLATDGNDIVHLKDTDGDGKADVRRAVLRGFYSADSHQDINSFVWGPAGELMMCQGLHAFGRVETPWGVERLEKAGAWRYWPKRQRLDPFLGWDRGPQNPWGVVFDDWGQPIMIAGNGQGVYYLLPNMIRTTHFLDPKQIGDTKGAKFCGVDIIGTRAMPDEAQGRMVAGSVMNNSVYWWTLEEAGSGFVAKNLPPLMTSSSTSFRVVDVKVGPDGAIYLADWFNPIIGHYQASLHHPARDKGHGRIWRITAKGRASVRAPELTKMTAAELLEQLKSPERWVRAQAKRVLAEMPLEKFEDALREWIVKLDPKDARFEHGLMEAIGVYESHERVQAGILERLLAAKDYRARAYAANVIGHWQDRLADPVALLRAAAADEHPRVRLAAIVSASYVPKAEAMAAALAVADRPMDRFIGEALTQATAALKPYWKPALDAGALAFEDKPERLAALARADGTADVLTAVTKLISSGKLTGASRDSAVLLLAGTGGPVEMGTVLMDPQVVTNRPLLAKVLDAVAANYRLRKQAPTLDVAAVLGGMIGGVGEPGAENGGDPEVRRGAIGLAGAMKVEALRGQVEKVASDPGAPAAVQRAACEALADLGGERSKAKLRAVVIDAMDGGGPNAKAMWAAAVASYARVDVADAARLAMGRITADRPPPSETPAIVGAFLARQGGAEALAAALDDVKLPTDAAKLALRAMTAAGRQDGKLWAALSKAAGNRGVKLAYDAQFVKALAAEAATSGDAAAGAAVFKGTVGNCVACHSVASGGINAARIGPDLSPLGTALPPDIVVESVLWPNRQIKEGYNAIVVETKDGDVLQGYRVTEDKAELRRGRTR
jgi:glucose/arabinose dehydrogenase